MTSLEDDLRGIGPQNLTGRQSIRKINAQENNLIGRQTHRNTITGGWLQQNPIMRRKKLQRRQSN